MSLYLLFSYSVAIFSLVTFSSIESLMTPQQYIDWKCGRICEEDSNLKRLIGPACVRLSATVQDPYDADTVKQNSGCHQVAVQFKDEDESKLAYLKEVGICTLKKDETRCITMGKGEKEMLVYSYDGNGCTLLDEGHFEMEIMEKGPTQEGGIVNAIYNACSALVSIKIL